MTKAELILHLENMKILAGDVGAKLKFYKSNAKNAPWGFTDGYNISLDMDTFERTPDFFWTVFFHEFSHILQKKNGWFKKFYSFKSSYRYDRLMRLKVEKFTDKMAAKIMRDYYPDLYFHACYDKKLLDKEKRRYKRDIRKQKKEV